MWIGKSRTLCAGVSSRASLRPYAAKVERQRTSAQSAHNQVFPRPSQETPVKCASAAGRNRAGSGLRRNGFRRGYSAEKERDKEIEKPRDLQRKLRGFCCGFSFRWDLLQPPHPRRREGWEREHWQQRNVVTLRLSTLPASSAGKSLARLSQLQCFDVLAHPS